MTLPAHSPFGGSSAERWINCPGSAELSKGIGDEDRDDTYSAPGTAAHAVAENCLKNREDAWQWVGSEHTTIVIDKEIADAVQIYVNQINHVYPDRDQGNSWIERKFHCPELHQLYYGMADFVYWDRGERYLDIYDFKYGAGIQVYPKDNPQLMYYACGVLESLQMWTTVDIIRLFIVQPRGSSNSIREWSISVYDLDQWLEDVCLPGIEKGLVSSETNSGSWCRFCPVVGRACPQILKDYDELEELMSVEKLTATQIGRFMDIYEVARMAHTKHNKQAYTMLQAGHEVPGYGLGPKKSNRAWKEGAEQAAIDMFGDVKIYEDRKMKSPNKLEDLPKGKAFVGEWSTKPDAGLTMKKGEGVKKNTILEGFKQHGEAG